MNMFRFDRSKTFKPQKGHRKGTRRYDLHKYAQSTLGGGDLKVAVELPSDADRQEWLAVNTVDFFNEVNLLYGTIIEFCTPESCPKMSAGDKFEYLWADGTTITKPMRCPAPVYVDYLMTWVESQLNDERLFPTTDDVPFPPDFEKIVKTIFKRLFRVYAHMYYQHFEPIVSLKLEAHLNTCFKHFVYFVLEYGLVAPKELTPMAPLIETLMAKDAAKKAASPPVREETIAEADTSTGSPAVPASTAGGAAGGSGEAPSGEAGAADDEEDGVLV